LNLLKPEKENSLTPRERKSLKQREGKLVNTEILENNPGYNKFKLFKDILCGYKTIGSYSEMEIF
jgi:hypothetical protein